MTRNEKEPGGNKLMFYFQNSTFLTQQEELALFIKNMPIIRIEELHSLNKLIEVLIRQNEALGRKCQQNVGTVKEMFSKHETLLRTNRQLQDQITDKDREMQHTAINHQQIDSYESQLTKLRKEGGERDQAVDRLELLRE